MLATKVPAGKAVEAESRICIVQSWTRLTVFARCSGGNVHAIVVAQRLHDNPRKDRLTLDRGRDTALQQAMGAKDFLRCSDVFLPQQKNHEVSLVWFNLVRARTGHRLVRCISAKRRRAQQRLKRQTSKGATAKNEQQVNERQINKSNVEKTKLRAIISSPTAVSANKSSV